MSDFNQPPAAPPPFPSQAPPSFPPAPPGYQQPPVYYQVAASRTSGLAIASMVLGILWIWWIGSILAVIFGHVAISQTHRDPTLRGKGMAIAGLVLGYIGVGTFLLVVIAAAASGTA